MTLKSMKPAERDEVGYASNDHKKRCRLYKGVEAGLSAATIDSKGPTSKAPNFVSQRYLRQASTVTKK